MNVGGLFPISFDRFGREFSLGVLGEKVIQEFAKGFGSGTSIGMIFDSSYFLCSVTRRSASAACAAAFVVNPTR